jgi:DNA repair protein RadC
MRPRERLCREGPAALADKELIAIMLNTGVKGKNVSELASDILELLENKHTVPTVKEISRLTGMGEAKSCVIAAMLEFGRRHWGMRGEKIRHPSDIYPLIRHYADRRQERLIGISLNGAHEVIATRIITVGLVNQTAAHPREVYADMIADRANAAIVAHNHPSGSIAPSPEDNSLTARLSESGKILGITLLDHVIFTEHSYYSYSLDGKLR